LTRHSLCRKQTNKAFFILGKERHVNFEKWQMCTQNGIYLVLCLLLFLIKIFTMSRTAYLILSCLPFVMIFFVKPSIWFFIYAWIYFTLIKLIRFHSVGLTIRQILLSYTPFGLKYWRRLFEKDDVNFHRPL